MMAPLLLALALVASASGAQAQGMNHDAASHTSGYVWSGTQVIVSRAIASDLMPGHPPRALAAPRMESRGRLERTYRISSFGTAFGAARPPGSPAKTLHARASQLARLASPPMLAERTTRGSPTLPLSSPPPRDGSRSLSPPPCCLFP